MDTATREGLGSRWAGLLAILVVGLLVAGTSFSVAAAAGDGARYRGMPEPEPFEGPTVTTGAASVRLSGRQMVYRINADTGAVTRQRRINFGFATIYSARDQVENHGGRRFIKLTSGRFRGWWVEARESSLTSSALADADTVRVKSGDLYALRFYSSGRIKTRLAVRLSSPATYKASQRANHNGRTFFLIAEGPLAGRWVSARKATLVDEPETPASPPPTTASAAATWKSLVLVYRETDVTFTRADGSDYRLQTRMNDSMYNLVLDTVSRYRASVRDWSAGLARVDLTVVDVPHPVTSLDRMHGYYWVGPNAIEADLDKYAPAGRYDSVFVVWRSRDKSGVEIPVGAWGWSLPAGSWSNGAGFSSVITPSWEWWWSNSPAPEEVFVHEWLHQVIYFHQDAGRMRLDLHAGSQYGYDNSDGTWRRWLSHVMQGRVRDGETYLGVSAEIWAAGQPTDP